MCTLGRRMKYRLGIYHKRPVRRCRKRIPARTVFCFWMAAILILCGFVFVKAEHRLGDVAGDIAVSKLNGEITTLCNEAVAQVLDETDIQYDEIFATNDKEGQITSMTTDFREVNQLKSALALKIQEKLDSLERMKVPVPIGALFSDRLITGVGFDMPVKVIVTNSIELKFYDDFSSAGINQTKHQLMVEIKVPAAVNAPGYKNETEIVTQVPVAETVIVGNVPNTYLTLGD